MLTVLGIVVTVVGIVVGVLTLQPVWRRIEAKRRAWKARHAKSFYDDTLIEHMSPAERLAKDRLYYAPGTWASAIRLWGADRDYAPPERLIAEYVHEPLHPPAELIADRERILKERAEAAERNGQQFFNGPNTRLIEWRANPKDGAGVALEEEHVYLQLGPVGWYDFTYLNEALRNERSASGLERTFEYFLSFSALVRDGTVRSSKLSNILDTATTIISSDGCVGYQERSGRVASVPGRLTSAVAENINRFWDETDPTDALHILHPEQINNPNERPDDTYKPTGIPHPLSAVRRGIGWEISPKVAESVDPRHIKLSGLSFDLEALHPDALFVVFVDIPHEKILELRRTHPGREHAEGKLLFVPATFESEETTQLMKNELWIPAGKASFIRALELLEAVKRVERTSFEGAFRLLSGPAKSAPRF